MKRLLTNSITDTARFPLKKGTLEFLQDSYKEAFASVMIALIGSTYNTSTVYVLYGVKNTGTDPVINTSAGAIFYNGEVFQIDAANFTVVNFPWFSIDISNYTTDADPVTFTDTVSRNVHNVRKMLLSDGGAGYGIAKLTQAVYLDFIIPPKVNITSPTSGVITGTYPNIVVTVPGSLYPIIYADTIHVGDVPSGGIQIDVLFHGGSIGTSSYVVSGSLVSLTDPHIDVYVSWGVIRSTMTDTGFSIRLQENGGGTNNIDFDFIIVKK